MQFLLKNLICDSFSFVKLLKMNHRSKIQMLNGNVKKEDEKIDTLHVFGMQTLQQLIHTTIY